MAEGSSNPKRPAPAFRDELAECWARMPDKGLFFGLLAAFLVLFHVVGNSTFGYVASPSLFRWMDNAYSAPGSEDSHGYLIPIVVLGLFWWKRSLLLAEPKRPWWPGLCLLGAALALHVAGYLIQQPRVSIVAMIGGVYALIALVWGWRFAWSATFPFALLLFCVPVGNLAEPITIPLRKLSTDISVFVSRSLLGIPVIQEGVQLYDPRGNYGYEVAAACSGIRSLITLVALTTIFGFVSFTTRWKRLLMVGLSLPLALGGNVSRLVCIILASEAFGREAGEFVHEWFGFVTFGIALAVTLGMGRWLEEPGPLAGTQLAVEVTKEAEIGKS